MTKLGVVVISKPKQPREIWLHDNLGINWSDVLVSGDTITSVTVTVRDDLGVATAGMLAGTAAIDGSKTGVPLQGGVSGRRYTVEFEIETALGGRYQAEILVPVTDLTYV